MKTRDEDGRELVPCELCGEPTPMLGVRRCYACWELEAAIMRNPEAARKILEGVEG